MIIVLMLAAVVSIAAVQAPAPRVVDIKTADAVVLKGTLFLAARPGPAVLLLHQCDEQRKVWDALGTRLAARGITALSVDYRGYGESGGTPHEKLSTAQLTEQQTKMWPSDIDSAFAFLSRQAGVDTKRLGAAGGSCGVEAAVQLAQKQRNIKALALLAGGTSRAGREFLATTNAPPTFTAAAADDQYANFVEIMGWYAARSQNTRSRMAQYKDGGHAAVMFVKHPGLADTISQWFAAVLASEKGVALPATNGVPMRAAVARVLAEIDQPGGAAVLGKRLAQARKTNANAQLFPEFFVNQLGYEHMTTRDFASAREIMKLNVTAYPKSPNAMDSLGDVYLAMGDTAAGLDAARKTLELLKGDVVDTEARKQGIREAAEGKLKRRSIPSPEEGT